MKIYLVRHANPIQSVTIPDIERSLSKVGKDECSLLANFLFENIRSIEIWCSTAARTCETLSEISKKWQVNEVSYFTDLYLADREALRKKICNSTSKEDLMIIGHNFGLSDLLLYFSGHAHTMHTCELIELNFEADTRREISKDTATVGLHFCPPSFPS